MDSAAEQEKSRAAFSSLLWCVFLTGIKLWAGLATGSLGILSEALHSALDLLAAGLTFFAVKIAARPADDDHPYGHEKVENLSALAETALLALTCCWIIGEAIERLFYHERPIELTWWAFLVVAAALAVDINRAAMLRHVARKHKSQALEADALHFTTDIWSSAVVLLGLACVWAAQFVPAGSAWQGILLNADSVAALIVAVLVCVVAFHLGKRAIHALMDGGSAALTKQVLGLMKSHMPDYPVKRIRLRDGGARVFVELDVEAPARLHVDAAHDVAESIEEMIRFELPGSDVIVHIEPGTEDYTQLGPGTAVHRLALRHHIRVHGFYAHQGEHAPCYFMDVEVPVDWDLAHAYRVVQVFRASVLAILKPEKVICRIEPDCRDQTPSQAGEVMSPEAICRKARLLLQQHHAIEGVLRIEPDTEHHATMLTCYCSAAATLSVPECHRIATQLEEQIKSALHHLTRVTVILIPQGEKA